MPGAKIFEVEKNSFTASLISVLLVNAILGGCGPAPQGGGTPKMRLPLSIMTKTKSMDQVWGPNSTTPFHSLFDFLVPPLLKLNEFSYYFATIRRGEFVRKVVIMCNFIAGICIRRI